MAFCSNCGNELKRGDVFCIECGHAVTREDKNDSSDRKQEYVGKIYKCPNCGAELKSFLANCPECGYEIRGAKSTNAVKEFALKLEAIEAEKKLEAPKNLAATLVLKKIILNADERKISLIKSFVVPNTKEDILEFMILATSNVDMKAFESIDEVTKGERAIADAWVSKIKQVYSKARISFGNDVDFKQIQRLYDECNVDITKSKKKSIIKWMLLVGWMPLMLIVLSIVTPLSNNRINKEEENRLTAIVQEIEQELESGEYKLALMNAQSIEYEGRDSERERYWGIQKQYLIDEIIERAERNGIYLDYSIDSYSEEGAETDDSGGFVSGFKEGFDKAVNPAIDDIKDSIKDIDKTNYESN